MDPMNLIPHGLPISAVERETGIAKDLLRMWERRYGFPEPARDDQGDRLYPREQIDKLRLVRRLMYLGFRPGKVMHLDSDALERMIDVHEPRREASPSTHDMVRLLRGRDHYAVRDYLHIQLDTLGTRPFVCDFLSETIEQVGSAWMRGEIEVYEEHLYTEQINRVLREALARLAMPAERPRVILTTCPGEQHVIGVLMVEAMLRLAGCETLAFGPEMPFTDTAHATVKHDADVVALSFSGAYDGDVQDATASLLELLPPDVELWVGGAGCRGLRSRPRCEVMTELSGIDGIVAAWRARQAARQE